MRQRIELTGTNSSIVLIALISNAHSLSRESVWCALITIDQFASFKTFLAGLVVFAERLNPIPSRTRPLNFPAPMVLSLKAWKSRSLPGLPRTDEAKNWSLVFQCTKRLSGESEWALEMRAIKTIELLVPVSSTRCRAYTPGLSTWWSTTALFRET